MRRFFKAWVVITVVVLLGLGVFSQVSTLSRLSQTSARVGRTTDRLTTLVHTECVRSASQAKLRAKLINDLTKHVATPAPGSPPGLFRTVRDRNFQLDAERKDLITIGKKIPNVKC